VRTTCATVERHRGLPRLAVADDQLALAAADRHHRIDRLQAGLQRLFHRHAIHDAGRETLDGRKLLRDDGSLAVDRLPERVDHPAEQLFADRHRDDATGALHQVAFLDLLEFAEEHRADALFFEVERDPEHAVREFEHLAGHRVLDAVHARDPVADRNDAAHFGHVDVDRVAPDLFPDDLGNLVCLDVHLYEILYLVIGSSGYLVI